MLNNLSVIACTHNEEIGMNRNRFHLAKFDLIRSKID